MRYNLKTAAVIAATLLLASCGGGGPDGFFGNQYGPGLGPLDFDLTSTASSPIDADAVQGYRVDLTHPNYINSDDNLPPGYRAVFGVLLQPDANPGGFDGTLTVRPNKGSSALLQGGGGSVFHVMTGDGAVVKAGKLSEGSDGSLNVADLEALGLLIFAEQTGSSFSISAFADVSSAQAGTEVHFWALANGGAAPVTFSWDFGDGDTDLGSAVSHIYATQGTYNVSVVGEDSLGVLSPAASTPIEITATPNPITGLTITGPVPVPNEPLSFSYGATANGGTPPFSYAWDFDGDGATDDSSGALVVHSFPAEGFYIGAVTVTDSNSTSASQEFVTDVRRVTLTGGPLSDESPLTVSFTLSSAGTNAEDSFVVDFGDGSTLTDPPASFDHTYVTPGDYGAVATATRTYNGIEHWASSNSVQVHALVSPGAPFLQLTQPIAGPAGGAGDVTFTAYGYNLGSAQGTRHLMLGGTEITPDTWGPNQIQFTIPAGTPVDDLTIDWNGGVSNLLRIDAGSGNPLIQNIIPLDNTPPNYMLIIGTGFGDLEGDVTINGVPMTVHGWRDQCILTRTPGGLATGFFDVVVSPFSGTPVPPFTTRLELSVPGGPQLDAVDASSLFGGGPPLTLTGSGFGSADGGLVLCDGLVIPALTWSDTSILLGDAPAPVDTWCVVLARNAVSNPLDIFDSIAPSITGISPPDAYEGLEITIQGNHFGAVQGPGTVEMNGFNLAVNSWSDTEIKVVLPAGISDGDVIIHRYVDSNAFPLNTIPKPPSPPDPTQI